MFSSECSEGEELEMDGETVVDTGGLELIGVQKGLEFAGESGGLESVEDVGRLGETTLALQLY